MFQTRPSELLEIHDAYTAFCVDEAAHYLLSQPEVPNYKKLQTKKKKTDEEKIKEKGGNEELVKLLSAMGAKVSI